MKKWLWENMTENGHLHEKQEILFFCSGNQTLVIQVTIKKWNLHHIL